MDSWVENLENLMKSYGMAVREQLKAQGLNDDLILQTDERWANEIYGWETDATVGNNACAIASLAMINAYWQHTPLTINQVLNWAGNDYFTDAGTLWSIFPAFAEKYGYKYKDLGTNVADALPYLKNNVPVLISVKPGRFTTVGHIMVLTHADDEYIRLLDPNDNENKNHALTSFSKEVIQKELRHIWVFIGE